MHWIKSLFGKGVDDTRRSAESTTPPAPASKPAHWRKAGEPGNPFDTALLDLIENLQLTAFSQDPAVAARAISWRAGQHARIARPSDFTAHTCDLRYPAAAELPEGMLYCPAQMEDKWVVAWVDGEIRLARSWSGETEAVAPATMRDGELQVERILTKPSSPLTAFGDCVATFDWLMRTHPLGERIPLSVDEAGAQLLEQAPTSGFSLFGRQLFCAAIHFPYPPSRGQLCSDGAVVAAIQRGETEALAQLIAAGASATAPSTMGGYLPLHLALHFKHAHMVDLLLRHGADVNQATRKGVTPLLVAVSAGSDPTQLALLLRRGADLEAGDQKGFRPLHEAAQHDHHDIVRWLIAQGAQCEARTAQGFTPLQIACALGSLRAAKALHAAGANIRADSPAGSALAIAQQQGQTEIYEWLRRLL